MTIIMRSDTFELGVIGSGIDVTSHEDQVTFYVPLTPNERRALAAALTWSLQDVARLRADLANQTPRGQWTRDDLPSVKRQVDRTSFVLDAVVDHLNAHHPKPAANAAEWLDRALNNPDERLIALDEARIEANIQRNRAERERDAAVARAEQLRDERDGALSAGLEALGSAERERDAAVARAEQAENARDTAATRAEQLEKKLAKVMSDYQDVEDERDEWKARAEAAEADNADAKIDGDPAVHVVRESDLPAARVDGDYYVVASAKGDYKWPQHGPSWWVGRAQDALAKAARYTSLARLAASEAVVDPVETKARVEADRRYSGDPNHAFIEGAIWAAHHAIGQEASSDE